MSATSSSIPHEVIQKLFYHVKIHDLQSLEKTLATLTLQEQLSDLFTLFD